MRISKERLLEIISVASEKGWEFAKNHFGLKREDTIRRYIAEAENLHLEIPNYTEGKNKVKVLAFDLELGKALFELFGTGKQYVRADCMVRDQLLFCWCGEWLQTGEQIGDYCTRAEIEAHNDKRVCKSLYNAIDEADIILGHNIGYFDMPMAKKKFIEYGFKPLAKKQQIDTYRIAKKNFRFQGNGLDFLSKEFGFSGKMETEKSLWKKVSEGSEEAMRKMYEYCQQDVKATIDLYFHMRGWMSWHPNIALLNEEEDVCPVCLSKNFYKDGYYYTVVHKYPQFRCNDCDSIFRSGKSSKDDKPDETVRLRVTPK